MSHLQQDIPNLSSGLRIESTVVVMSVLWCERVSVCVREVTHVVGSSKKIILGSPINAIAMLSLLLIPPDILDTNILAALSSPTYTRTHSHG